MLPEDLRSSIVKNYGRRLINEYADDLLAAVAFWRQVGAWRSKLRKKVSPAPAPSAPVDPIASGNRNVIALAEALAERRRASVVQTILHSDEQSESEDALDRPMTAAR